MSTDLTELQGRVLQDLETYEPPFSEGALGVPLPQEWFEERVAEMRMALLHPYPVRMRDEGRDRGVVVLDVLVVADDGDGDLVAYDAAADDFVLAVRDADPVQSRGVNIVSCGVRGGAVDCFLAR